MKNNIKAFTLIEVITAIVIIAIVMIPVTVMGIEYVRSIAYADSLTTATNLARREMGIVNNLNYNDPGLADGYDAVTSNYEGYNCDMRRTVSYVPGTDNNLKMARIRAYPGGSSQQLIELATYVMDISFGVGGGNRAVNFSASGGSMSRTSDQLSNITLQNASLDTKTMIGVIISSNRARTLTTISMGGALRYSGPNIPLPSGLTTETQVLFQDNFVMPPGTTYSGSQGGAFTFTDNSIRNDTIQLRFVFSDGSKAPAPPAAAYSWTTPR